MKLTKSQELLFKAGVCAGKSKAYEKIRSRFPRYYPQWDELDDLTKYYRAKSERYLKRAEKEMKHETK